MNKYDVIKQVFNHLSDELVVTNLGVLSKIAYMAQDRAENFYMTGSMGLATSIALGLAIGQKRRVICFEGDGSLLMNLGSLPTIGSINRDNLVVFLMDDQVYQSTGSQKTLNNAKMNLGRIAEKSGITMFYCDCLDELGSVIEKCLSLNNCSFIHLLINESIDSSKIPMRPVEIKNRFMSAQNKLEK